MPYNSFPQVNEIIAGVSQDIHSQLNATADPGLTILIDYANRIQKQMLRFSRWNFLLSDYQFFLTVKGQTNYWIGPTSDLPLGFVDTGLNLRDVDKIKKDSVIDVSNVTAIKWLSQPPITITTVDRTGMGRPNRPTNFVQTSNFPSQLLLFPPSDNSSVSQPQPLTPNTVVAPGGALVARTYFTRVTYVDSKGGESTPASAGREQYIPANSLITVKSPTISFIQASSGVRYDRYNVYAALATQSSSTNQPLEPGTETLQNVSPITIGTDWTEPGTGLITTGVAFPTKNTLEQFGAYLIKFQYYKARTNLRDGQDYIQIPEDYKDVMIQGINALAFKLLGKNEESQHSFQMYRAGLTEMVWDKNLFPEGVEFIRPDTSSFINQQILGEIPPFF